MEYSNLFVCLMGLGIVFFGLICIILLTYLMSYCCRDKKKSTPLPRTGTPSAQPAVSAAPAADRQAMIAAISAAIAEDLGTDLSGIRILSVKKL
jgi:sodium pump decarboxylases, gamma subunit